MHIKGRGRKRSWPNYINYPWICIKGMRKITLNLSQDSLSPGRHFNTKPHKPLEREVLP
jgi:hypothetical protein